MELVQFLSVYEQESRMRGSAEADLLATIIQLLREEKVGDLLPQLHGLVEQPTTPPEVTALFSAIIDALEHPA